MLDHPIYHAILDDPDNDQLRLVLADWLDEQGDPRGEFIRVQVSISDAQAKNEPVDQDLRHRADKLFADHRERWRRQLEQEFKSQCKAAALTSKNVLQHVLYYRGFASWIGTDIQTWNQYGRVLIKSSPWQYLRLSGYPVDQNRDIEADAMTHIRTLTVNSSEQYAPSWETFLRSPNLSKLERLVIQTATDVSFGHLVRSLRSEGALSGLTHFSINSKSIDLNS